MGVDFLTCHNCGHNFPDCGEFVSCESCGTNWCDRECAEEDGYIEEHCTKYEVFGYDELSATRDNRKCPHKYCDDDCEFYVPNSCNLCRGEDYEDEELLEKALELLHMKREDLIGKMKA